MENFGSELAPITNDEENYLVYRIGIDNNLNDSVWIGFTDSHLEGNWQWLKNNKSTTISYTNWVDNLKYEIGQQDCASMILHQQQLLCCQEYLFLVIYFLFQFNTNTNI